MDIQEITNGLRARLDELSERLERLKADAGRLHSNDFADMAQERENDEVVDAIGNETREEMRQIQSALVRIDEGNYGRCLGCREAIAEERLVVVPWASHCAGCA